MSTIQGAPTPHPALERLVAHLREENSSYRLELLELWERLSPREQLLFKEAAVMGYVQGAMAPPEERVPRDHLILTMVLSGIRSNGDLYPTVSGYVAEEEEYEELEEAEDVLP